MPCWTDEGRCSSCHYCGMDMDMDPYCVNEEVLKSAKEIHKRDFEWGISINGAVPICQMNFRKAKKDRVLLWHPESDSYIEEFSREEVEKALLYADCSDVTGILQHERNFIEYEKIRKNGEAAKTANQEVLQI